MRATRFLVINCGSSSIKCAVVEGAPRASTFELRVDHIGRPVAKLVANGATRDIPGPLDARAAIDAAFEELRRDWSRHGRLDAVVHRVVHGGEAFTAPIVLDDAACARLEPLNALAPLHNPPALHAIYRARELFANLPHVAVFDTAFHATLPDAARTYALPAAVRRDYGIRRFGFHGISHARVARLVPEFLGRDTGQLRIVSCHLGGGASVTAIAHGRSVDTSMGMTPLEGLVMGTRAGDVDPGVITELAQHMRPEALLHLLNHGGGLLALAGTDDVREIEKRALAGNEDCRLALAVYAHRLRRHIGAAAAVLGGIDALVFTGGVGENSAHVRELAVTGLEFLGLRLDAAANAAAHTGPRIPCIDIGAPGAGARLLVARTDEALEMADEAAALLAGRARPIGTRRIPIAVSARHAHLCQSTLDRLFGPGYRLKPRAALSQTGQFSAQETVRLVGPRGCLEHVRLMGPARDQDQIEISASDERALGIDAPLRLSGDLDGTPGVVVEGPEGRVALAHGVICARRHIHMNPMDALDLGVAHGDTVAVHIDSAGRDLTFGDVSVRVDPRFRLELHLDTDEANAAGVTSCDAALIAART